MIDKEAAELEKALEKIWDIAINKFHLDPFPVRFEIVPATVMYEIANQQPRAMQAIRGVVRSELRLQVRHR